MDAYPERKAVPAREAGSLLPARLAGSAVARRTRRPVLPRSVPLMRWAVVVAAVFAVAACATVEPPTSDLSAGSKEFRLELSVGAPGHAHEHARRCFKTGATTEALRRGNVWSAATSEGASEDQNRTLHRCLLVIRDAQVDVQ